VEELSLKHEAELQKVELMLTNERVIEEKTQEIARMEKEIEGFDEMVPDHIDTPQVVYDFYTYSVDHQVTPTYLSFSEPVLLETAPPPVEGASTVPAEGKKDELISTLSLNFTAQGKHGDMIRFLADLEKISELELTIENIDMYNTEDNLMEVVINFRQYVRGLDASDLPYADYTFFEDSTGYDDLESIFGKTSSAGSQSTGVESEGQNDEP